MKIACEAQHQRHLHELGRLKSDPAEVNPSLCAHTSRTSHFDQHEECQAEEIDDIGIVHPHANIDQCDYQHQAETNAEAHQLARRPWIPTLGRRVQHGNAESRDYDEQ